MSENCLMIGGFSKFGKKISHSVFSYHHIHDGRTELKTKKNGYIKVNHHKYYRAVIVFSKDKKCKDTATIVIDGHKRCIRSGTIILNENGKLTYIEMDLPKLKKIPSFLHEFISNHEVSGTKNNFDTFQITATIKGCIGTSGDWQPISLQLTSNKGVYKFINWQVQNTRTGLILSPCSGGSNEFALIVEIQGEDEYAADFDIGYICEDSSGNRYFAYQYFVQNPPNTGATVVPYFPYNVTNPSSKPY